jgi:hypothetical protein
MPNVRFAARKNWPRNFPPSLQPARAMPRRPAKSLLAADITVAAAVASIESPAAVLSVLL